MALVAAVVTVAVTAGLLWAGVVHPNNPSREQHPVRGVDVSRYQGEVDWPVLAGQGIDFAFIKATEGSSYVDPHFALNLKGATDAGLRVGAYHFFSFESAGTTQADNVIKVVSSGSGATPAGCRSGVLRRVLDEPATGRGCSA